MLTGSIFFFFFRFVVVSVFAIRSFAQGTKTEIYIKINLLCGQQQQEELRRGAEYRTETETRASKLTAPSDPYPQPQFFFSQPILYNFEIRAHHQPISKSLFGVGVFFIVYLERYRKSWQSMSPFGSILSKLSILYLLDRI